MEACVSPEVKGRGGASAVPTTPSEVVTRTRTWSAWCTLPLAKCRGLLHGMANGMASMAVILMR